jgi:hypothetical protein
MNIWRRSLTGPQPRNRQEDDAVIDDEDDEWETIETDDEDGEAGDGERKRRLFWNR